MKVSDCNDQLAAAPRRTMENSEATSGEMWCEEELAREKANDGSERERVEPGESVEAQPSDPDLWLYRDRTCAILRRYMRLAVEVGRLPALLGREFFRTRVTSYHTQTFEDTVIFVHDVECCLSLLSDAEIELVAMLVAEEHQHVEAAGKLRCTRRTVVRTYGEVLDKISDIFLEREILSRLPQKSRTCAEPCQGGEKSEIAASA